MTMAQPKGPLVSIRAPAWGATHRLALIDIDHIVSIRAPAWGANNTLSFLALYRFRLLHQKINEAADFRAEVTAVGVGGVQGDAA